MSVDYKDFTKQFLDAYERKLEEALERIGLEWLKQVTEIVNTRYGRPIVDTGKYRQGMRYEVDIRNKEIIFGNIMEYAEKIELGSSRMMARPVIEPSIMEFIPLYEEILKNTLGEGWSAVIK